MFAFFGSSYFYKKLNDAGVYEGKVVVIQPIDKGMVNMLNDQNCEYNLYLRGLQNGKEVIEHTCQCSTTAKKCIFLSFLFE